MNRSSARRSLSAARYAATMTLTSTTIRLHRPFSLAATRAPNLFLASEALESGIYIWTLQVYGARWVYYIGETGKSFIERHLEHISNYYDGQNRIYDPTALARAGKSSSGIGLSAPARDVGAPGSGLGSISWHP